jgi:hydroxymethylbilane synthase
MIISDVSPSNTRLSKLDSPKSPYTAIILAHSGLSRLGSAHRITSILSSPTLYHAVGQGALGVELRVGDHRTREALRGVGHWETEWRCGAERGCLRVLEGGCSVPVGVESILEELEEGSIDLKKEEEEQDKGLKFDSPMLHFSGILPDDTPFPTVETPSIRDPLIQRRARLTLRVCVTSIDGVRQSIHHPEAVVVGSYQQAERFGEKCAREIKGMGAGEILEEVADIRRERERKDLERAIEKSRREAGISGNGNGSDSGEHEGLQGLVRTLAGTRMEEHRPSA